MSDILVVDDSPMQRTLIAGVLNKQLADANVVSASGGAEAIQLLESRRFDLVITDLLMPGLDGLELVKEIRRRDWDLPVVLMTGFGNEETAVNALRAGAASYVPKRELHVHLAPTVEGILSLSHSRRSKERLLACVSGVEIKFCIGNDDSLLSPLVAHIQDQIRLMRLLEERDVVRLAVALHEALTNAVLHGNLEVSSDLRQADESLFHLLADQRRRQAPYCDRQVSVTASLSADEVRLSVRDQGPGFDVRQAMDPDRPIDLERIGGRGLLVMQSFMDVVYHNASGNEITMIKFTSAQQRPQNTAIVDCESQLTEALVG